MSIMNKLLAMTLVDCLNCKKGFGTTRNKPTNEIVVCNHCGFEHALDIDSNENGQFWYLVPLKKH